MYIYDWLTAEWWRRACMDTVSQWRSQTRCRA